jgi:hypothetical protein
MNLPPDSLAPASSATILGLKVVGGKLLSNGRYGAVIEKVKKGSVADTVAHLLPGKLHILLPPTPTTAVTT